jgi:phosphoglycerate dehydrogenase-like enzyme
MKLVIQPPVEAERLARIREAAGPMEVVNAADEAEALRQMPAADAFFGKITPSLLAASTRLRWVQAPAR